MKALFSIKNTLFQDVFPFELESTHISESVKQISIKRSNRREKWMEPLELA